MNCAPTGKVLSRWTVCVRCQWALLIDVEQRNNVLGCIEHSFPHPLAEVERLLRALINRRVEYYKLAGHCVSGKTPIASSTPLKAKDVEIATLDEV